MEKFEQEILEELIKADTALLVSLAKRPYLVKEYNSSWEHGKLLVEVEWFELDELDDSR
jgi:hypothetical protein